MTAVAEGNFQEVNRGCCADPEMTETRAWACPECLKAEAEWAAQWLRERS
ncbi:MAG: hypothetical protein JWO82_4391 [Akkermansiaceae bacterium]|nr:hypothetical protein [Akkermansiaceae bacterium]